MSDDATDNSLGGAERELESALRSLAPAGHLTIDPISAAFEAGKRTQARATRLWRGTSFLASLAAVALTIVSLPHPEKSGRPQTVTRVAQAPAERSDVPEQSVIRLRDVVLDRGWSALPAAAGGGSGRAVSVRDTL